MKYSCRDIQELLPVYVDNMTNQIESAMIGEHLETCAECRREYEFLKNIIDTTMTLPSLEISKDFNDKLHQKLVEAKNANRTKTLSAFKKSVAITLSSAAVIAISVISLNALSDKDMIDSVPESTATSTPHEINEEVIDEALNSDAVKKDEAEETASMPPEDRAEDIPTAKATQNLQETVKAVSDESPKKESKPAAETASDYNTTQNATEIAAPAALTSLESAVYSGGSVSGGGSSSAARAAVPQKVKVTVSVSVNEADSVLATQILSGYTYQNGAYVLSSSEYHKVGAKLSEMGASLTITKEDKTSEYTALQAQFENASGSEAQSIQNKLNQIDNEISKTYIVFN